MSDAEKLAADLVAFSEVVDDIHGVVRKGALNIKNDWRDSATGLRHAPMYPRSITYETKATRKVVEAEIGPDKDRPQGALGNLIEFGSAHNPPHNNGGAALLNEEPRFVAAVEDVLRRKL